MQYRIDPKSGNKLSALGYGCMRFPKKGQGFDYDKTSELINTALDAGVNYFDTAYIYGNSEETLGKILTPDKRKRIYIATKLPLILVKKQSDFDKYFVQQLKRLNTDYIDYYLMHMITGSDLWRHLQSLGIEDWIAKRKQAGDIINIGFSYHGGKDDFVKIIDAYDWDLTQIQYNYLDENNQAGKSGLEYAASKNLPVVVMEPLRGGKLVNNLPQEAAAAFSGAGVTPAEAALRWVWNHPAVTVLLSGMSDMNQLSENLRIADDAEPKSLSEKVSGAIVTAVDSINKKTKVPCTGCGYCMPCPAGVEIPGCFTAYNMKYTDGFGAGMGLYLQLTNVMSRTPHTASLCKNCGMCEKHCPQSIPIRANLANAARELEPWWFRLGTGAYRKLMRKEKP